MQDTFQVTVTAEGVGCPGIEGVTSNAPLLLPEPPAFFRITEGEVFDYHLGDVFDADGDKVTIEYALNKASSFITVIDDQRELKKILSDRPHQNGYAASQVSQDFDSCVRYVSVLI